MQLQSTLSLTCLIFLGGLVLGACGSSNETQTSQATGSSTSRSADPRLLKARAALEAGRPSTAESLLVSLGKAAGVEGPLCMARVHLVQGQTVAALAQIEEARRINPRDARVFAGAAEILALAGRDVSAVEELAKGVSFEPNSPDLARAQAFLELTRPGQGQIALKRLQAALAADPKLPYCRWPMAQAHLLTGRAALTAGEPLVAADHARSALELEQGLATAEELLGSALALTEDFGPALEALYRASDQGLDVQAQVIEIHLRAAMAARLQGTMETAEGHYMGARAAGASKEVLSTGAPFLEDRARLAFQDGMAAGLRDAFGEAVAAYERSLALAPTGALAMDAMDGLAAARFRMEDYEGADLAWGQLLVAEAQSGALDGSRTHLNIARCRVLSGNSAGAKEVLKAALSRLPKGEVAEETRDLLARVPKN